MLNIGRSLETAQLQATAIEDNESNDTTSHRNLLNAIRHSQRYKAGRGTRMG